MIDIGQIFSDRMLLYMLLAFSGIISLIIFGMIPPIGAAFLKTILKNQNLAISNTQSRVLAAIGLILIVFGSIGIILEANSPPSIYVSTIPKSYVTIDSTNSTSIIITAMASDPDAKSIVKELFGNKEELLYTYIYEGPGIKNGRFRFAENTNQSVMNLSFNRNDIGTNIITVNVTDRPAGDKKAKWGFQSIPFEVKRHNSQPEIIDVKPNKKSPQPAGSTIMFHVEAVDHDGDDIIYKLKIMRTINSKIEFEDVGGWTSERDLIWMSDENDKGENYIRIFVGDKDHNGEDEYEQLLDPYMIESSR